ncbi:metallophosphoesterase [Mesosutterella sp. AGMB02718]|uniref:Metallophosphoesterase n=1 Tax=Mesosutterella faecium TaxID=2925194 RepID=A0ABT7IJI9_9BURK|nr:metallophosphoesterase [Mesosutterella sp. AGMB02718]MDL2058538.1 metallophosphoesterase [Mesosutterella sp. AGMB02718]
MSSHGHRRHDAGRRGPLKRKAQLPEIFFCGDPHGEFDQINTAAREYKPDAMIILGDLQPPDELDRVLEEALAFTDVWWIPGNHDSDTDAYYDRLWKGPLASHNLHGRVGNVAGLRVAGLGGVFRGQIWMPDGEPNYSSVGSFLRRIGRNNTWRGGLPRRHRTTIFPSVYENLSRQHADILVTHEAPSCHRKGFAAIDRLAQDLHVRWLFHGHQHESIAYGKCGGIWTRAVGLRGIVNLRGEEVVESQLDPKDAAAMAARGELVLGSSGGDATLVVIDEKCCSAKAQTLKGKIVAQPWRTSDQLSSRPKKG